MWPDLADTRELASVLDVLGAMITPAILILASSSLLITTSQRSIRCIDRVRERAEEVQALGKGEDVGTQRRRNHLFRQLDINTRRARLLLRTMSLLYIAISFFIATSISIGTVSLLHIDIGWVPMVLGFFGALLLFAASIYLIVESNMALSTTAEEMDYIASNYMQRS